MSHPALLSITYFGPIQWYSKWLLHNEILIEKEENFSRQSYRNRCDIFSANGKIALSIPIIKEGSGVKTPIRKIRIDNQDNWRKIHLKAIESAYRNAPFFEFFYDDVDEIINRNYTYLWELNMAIIENMLEHLEIETSFCFTEKYDNTAPQLIDYRQSIHPKKRCQLPDSTFAIHPYKQVFDEKYNFIENLSILDLLFNEGPNALTILEGSIKYAK